jgi:hypothetical protein
MLHDFIIVITVFTTRVHQTLDDKENADYVEKHGPFPANPDGGLYLGTGTYFWDDHLELAHWWGDVHLDGKYMICEADLNVKKTMFCDLVGSRQDMQHLKQMIDELNISHLRLGAIIEVLKTVEKKRGKGDVFPFLVIRAVDDSPTSFEREEIYFAEEKKGYTSLTPVYLICLIAKSSLFLSSYRVVYPEFYKNGD